MVTEVSRNVLHNIHKCDSFHCLFNNNIWKSSIDPHLTLVGFSSHGLEMFDLFHSHYACNFKQLSLDN